MQTLRARRDSIRERCAFEHSGMQMQTLRSIRLPDTALQALRARRTASCAEETQTFARIQRHAACLLLLSLLVFQHVFCWFVY